MDSWTDKKDRHYWRLDSPQDEIFLKTRYNLFDWRDIAALCSCSRMTAYRILAAIQQRTPHHIFYLIYRYPGHRAQTIRYAPRFDVLRAIEEKRSCGNPGFYDSEYQSTLARRSRRKGNTYDG